MAVNKDWRQFKEYIGYDTIFAISPFNEVVSFFLFQ